MTKKSTGTTWRELESRGSLIRFVPPLDPDEAEKRSLLLLPRHYRWLTSIEGTDEALKYKSQVRAALGEFVRGDIIYDDDTTIKLLRPPHLNAWVYRILFAPHARIIGGFAERDVFIGLERRFRHELDGDEYDAARDRAIDKWQTLFGGLKPLAAPSLAHCICNVGT